MISVCRCAIAIKVRLALFRVTPIITYFTYVEYVAGSFVADPFRSVDSHPKNRESHDFSVGWHESAGIVPMVGVNGRRCGVNVSDHTGKFNYR